MPNDVMLSPLQVLATKLARGDVTALAQVLKEIAPPEESAPKPAKIPVPAVITNEEVQALYDLIVWFGSVVPDTKRVLDQEELDSLQQERKVLKTIASLVGDRIDNITLTVHNHFDAQLESTKTPEELEKIVRTEKGYYLTDEEAPSPDLGVRFKRSRVMGTPGVSLEKLEEISEDPEVATFSRKEYLACTTPTRVFDENKFMLLLRKNPDLLKILQEALVPGKSHATITAPVLKGK